MSGDARTSSTRVSFTCYKCCCGWYMTDIEKCVSQSYSDDHLPSSPARLHLYVRGFFLLHITSLCATSPVLVSAILPFISTDISHYHLLSQNSIILLFYSILLNYSVWNLEIRNYLKFRNFVLQIHVIVSTLKSCCLMLIHLYIQMVFIICAGFFHLTLLTLK